MAEQPPNLLQLPLSAILAFSSRRSPSPLLLIHLGPVPALSPVPTLQPSLAMLWIVLLTVMWALSSAALQPQRLQPQMLQLKSL
ncbi:MAG: uncharacterized protein KVP18_000696 [Porospora cf. gigantea A]|uniref:uncharacterized protein n=1 Tax=Porospora cf. gigantea A TaxID=2853593 RepID=UPI00355A090E|nr:MAG: hypothetical protein KVP18_000696 [Porospora cf. gigantea A]